MSRGPSGASSRGARAATATYTVPSDAIAAARCGNWGSSGALGRSMARRGGARARPEGGRIHARSYRKRASSQARLYSRGAIGRGRLDPRSRARPRSTAEDRSPRCRRREALLPHAPAPARPPRALRALAACDGRAPSPVAAPVASPAPRRTPSPARARGGTRRHRNRPYVMVSLPRHATGCRQFAQPPAARPSSGTPAGPSSCDVARGRPSGPGDRAIHLEFTLRHRLPPRA